MALTPQKQARTKWDMDRIVTFDIESYDWTNAIALGMYQGKYDKYTEFIGDDCISEFVSEILKEKWTSHRFVAHNGGNYDFIPVIEELTKQLRERNEKLPENKRWDIDILTKGPGDTPFLVVIKRLKRKYDKEGEEKWVSDNRTFYLQDSIALMPRGLETLAESFAPDMPKLDFDLEKIGKISEMENSDIEEMQEYLERDCVTLYKILEKFTAIIRELSNDNCGAQTTIGSTAMTVYRTTYMADMKIENCYRPENITNPESKFRDTYYGGRTEVFKQYGENLYHYDVNSLYPYVYTHKKIPIGKIGNLGTFFPLDDESVGGAVKIKGYVPKDGANGIPVLPRRIVSNDGSEKVIFGYGNIEGWYMASEIRYAKEVGALEDIEILDSYGTSYGKPFEEYGGTLYDMKMNINKNEQPAKYDIVKLLLNSFYGKFGMDRDQSSIVWGPVTRSFQSGKRIINDELANGGIMAKDDTASSAYILPRIASSITANARIEMHKWLMKCFDKGGEVYYCDTDSVVTDVKLEESDELGGMDLEGELEKGIFLAPKVYAELYGDNEYLVKAKGMRNGTFSFYHFEKAYQDSMPGLVSASWEGPRGFKAGMKNQEDSWFVKADYNRSLKKFDSKRVHKENKSYPLNLDEQDLVEPQEDLTDKQLVEKYRERYNKLEETEEK